MGAHVEPVNNCNGAFSAWAPRASAGNAAVSANEASLLEASRGRIGSSSSGAFAEDHGKFPYEARGILAMTRWAACAKEQACVCPVGSNRGNHRQDQAALTMTLATVGLR